MAIKISIALQKGGSAKTTTAVNLASILQSKGNRVLLVDADAQANATFYSGISSKTLDNSFYNVLTTDKRYKCSAGDAVIETEYYSIIPADKDVSDLLQELKLPTALKSALAPIEARYDYIIIDTPPALNMITINAFTTSDYIILPTEPRPFNFTGMVDIEATIAEVRQRWNPSLQVAGILLVKHHTRTRINKALQKLIEDYADRLHTQCFRSTIREGVAVPESQLAQKPLINYAPSAKLTADYIQFVDELTERIGDK